MKRLRFLLFPFSLLYGLIVWLRNTAYDRGWLRAEAFATPVIAVGNLNVGGTGKTPMIEYLIDLLKQERKLAVLSRGYKRKTKGFVLASANTDSSEIGDEPYQYFRKFNGIRVAVDENRVNGVKQLLGLPSPPDLVLLDDAFQHRRIQAGIYVLMTRFGDLYTDDYLLPVGNLREFSAGASRADLIVVSKCPDDLTSDQRDRLKAKLNVNPLQEVFFTRVDYSVLAQGRNDTLSLEELRSKHVLLVTGIAHPRPLEDYLVDMGIRVEHMEFGDHHQFSERDFEKMRETLSGLDEDSRILLTTEKDFVRDLMDRDLSAYYVPIKASFLEGEDRFIKQIQNYVRKD